MKTIDDFNFSGKRALVRVDYNVPLDKAFQITDDTRMVASLPTINKILDDGGSVVLMSHMGRPWKKLKEDGTVDIEKFTLRNLVGPLAVLLGRDIAFSPDCVGQGAKVLAENLKPGEVLLLENMRFHKEEENGDEDFARQLAELGDVYVNDAFGTAHRAHASTAIVAKFFPKENVLCGKLMEGEIVNAKKVMEDPQKPFTAIIGGAKVSGKIDILQNLLDKADCIIIGGGMAYTFFRAMGYSVGGSMVEDDRVGMANDILKKAKHKGVELLLPVDSVIADKFDNDAQVKIADNKSIPEGWMGLDIGPQAVAAFVDRITSSKTILWNGPMGVFEMENFSKGTSAIAKAVAAATENGAFSLVGGGDSVAAVNQLGFADKISYISTGGGALLEYFEGKTLPWIAVLE